jgi:hypothetical protein
LREKVKINYTINSNQIKLKSKISKKSVLLSRKQPRRDAKGFKNKKMTLNSDSEDDYED